MDIPTKGSRWYAFGRHVEIVEVFQRDGEIHVRERDLRTKQKLPSVPLWLWERKAIERNVKGE